MPDTIPDDLVRSFLAERDLACPGCNYNLRGVGEPKCPECGRPIQLTVSRPSHGRGYLWFVLLALCWVVTASSMNGFRWWKNVRSEASAVQFFSPLAMTRNLNTTLNPGQSRRITTPGVPITAIAPSTSSAPSTLTITRQSVIVSGAASFSYSSSGTPAVKWSNVSTATWATFGYWSSLGLLALAALVICLVHRRRFHAESPPRALLGTAIALFVLYAGYHAIMFANEVIS